MSNAYLINDLLEVVGNMLGLLFSIAIIVVIIVSRWFIFKKANRPGWASIVPFYNNYVLFDIAGKRPLFWGYLGLQVFAVLSWFVVFGIFLFSYKSGMVMAGSVANLMGRIIFYIIMEMGLLLLISIVGFVLMVIMYKSLANNFGKGWGFTLGLLFFPYVFYPILAFDKGIVYLPNMQYYGQNGNQYNGYNQQNMNQYQNQYNGYNQQNMNQYQNQYNGYSQQNMNQYQNQYNGYSQQNINQYNDQNSDQQ